MTYFSEVSVEAQWVQIFQGSKFPSWQDKQHGIYPSLGEIELSKSLMSAANYSDLPGNFLAKCNYFFFCLLCNACASNGPSLCSVTCERSSENRMRYPVALLHLSPKLFLGILSLCFMKMCIQTIHSAVSSVARLQYISVNK